MTSQPSEIDHVSDLLLRHHFTVRDFYAMVESGVLTENDRVELIEGEILDMTPINSQHAGCLKRLIRFFSQTTRGGVLLGVQDPVRLSEHSEPQPDLVLLKPRDDDYSRSHPGPDDVLLLIEVAESSLNYDRGVKVPLYARAGVREVWIVDLTAAAIEIYRDPIGGGYAHSRRATDDETIEPKTVPGATITVGDVVKP